MTRAVTPTPTPNPNAMRFSLGESRPDREPRLRRAPRPPPGRPGPAASSRSPGVVSLFAVNDFVTVTKDTHAGWEAIVPHVVEVLQSATFE